MTNRVNEFDAISQEYFLISFSFYIASEDNAFQNFPLSRNLLGNEQNQMTLGNYQMNMD